MTTVAEKLKDIYILVRAYHKLSTSWVVECENYSETFHAAHKKKKTKESETLILSSCFSLARCSGIKRELMYKSFSANVEKCVQKEVA